MDYYERTQRRAEGDAVLLGRVGIVLALVAIIASCSIRVEHTPECVVQQEKRHG